MEILERVQDLKMRIDYWELDLKGLGLYVSPQEVSEQFEALFKATTDLIRVAISASMDLPICGEIFMIKTTLKRLKQKALANMEMDGSLDHGAMDPRISTDNCNNTEVPEVQIVDNIGDNIGQRSPWSNPFSVYDDCVGRGQVADNIDYNIGQRSLHSNPFDVDRNCLGRGQVADNITYNIGQQSPRFNPFDVDGGCVNRGQVVDNITSNIGQRSPRHTKNLIDLSTPMEGCETDFIQEENISMKEISNSRIRLEESFEDNWSSTMNRFMSNQEQRVLNMGEGLNAIRSSSSRIESMGQEIQENLEILRSTSKRNGNQMQGLINMLQASSERVNTVETQANLRVTDLDNKLRKIRENGSNLGMFLGLEDELSSTTVQGSFATEMESLTFEMNELNQARYKQRIVTEQLTIDVLELQERINSSLRCSTYNSSNRGVENAQLENKCRERDIVKKGMERIEKEIAQYTQVKISRDEVDIALIKKCK